MFLIAYNPSPTARGNLVDREEAKHIYISYYQRRPSTYALQKRLRSRFALLEVIVGITTKIVKASICHDFISWSCTKLHAYAIGHHLMLASHALQSSQDASNVWRRHANLFHHNVTIVSFARISKLSSYTTSDRKANTLSTSLTIAITWPLCGDQMDAYLHFLQDNNLLQLSSCSLRCPDRRKSSSQIEATRSFIIRIFFLRDWS